MIYQKEILAPVFRRRSVRRELSLFCEKSGAVAASGLHFMQGERGLVCAEGYRAVGEESGTLFASQGHGSVRFGFTAPVLTYPGGVFPFSYRPNAIFCFADKAGTKNFYALADAGCYRLALDHPYRIGEGGTCGAVHGERLFTANGFRLNWTAPLDFSDAEEKLQGAGHVDLPSEGGNILAVVSLGETLVLFRERGIVRFAGKGDALAFSAGHAPFPGGVIRGGTVQKCGESAFFLTENGLYVYDGKSCARRSDCGFSHLDLTETATAACGGNYYATAKFCGEPCIWCVMPEGGHLIRARAEQLAAADRLYFTEGNALYTLDGRQTPLMRRSECVLNTERSLFGLSARQKYLDGVLIEGKGHFRIEARGESGLPRAVIGRAGERLRFPLPVRGTGFSLGLKTLDADACVKAVVLDLREEVAKW